MSCQEVFAKQLRERGYRLTPQREMVLSVMHQIEGFATAEEVYDRVQEISACVDLSTVYRTLDLLQEFQLVAAVDLGHGQRRYELLGTRDPHLHLACRSCGKVLRVGLEEVWMFTDYLAQAHGFEAELEHVTISGLCQECRATHEEALGVESTLA